MIEKKISKTEKVQLKGLLIQDGTIIDSDGCIRDLNKIVTMAFGEGDVFDFTVNSKSDDSQILEESGDDYDE